MVFAKKDDPDTVDPMMTYMITPSSGGTPDYSGMGNQTLMAASSSGYRPPTTRMAASSSGYRPPTTRMAASSSGYRPPATRMGLESSGSGSGQTQTIKRTNMMAYSSGFSQTRMGFESSGSSQPRMGSNAQDKPQTKMMADSSGFTFDDY
jgi:hypothetical protein